MSTYTYWDVYVDIPEQKQRGKNRGAYKHFRETKKFSGGGNKMQKEKIENTDMEFDSAAEEGFVPICMMLTRKPPEASSVTESMPREVQND